MNLYLTVEVSSLPNLMSTFLPSYTVAVVWSRPVKPSSNTICTSPFLTRPPSNTVATFGIVSVVVCGKSGGFVLLIISLKSSSDE